MNGDGSDEGGRDAVADASPGDATDASQECDAATPLRLEALTYQGLPMSLFVPALFQHSPSLMHLDSAAGFSILYLSEGTPWTTHAGEARIGCELRPLDGLGVIDPGFGTALPVVGTLGGDWLLEAPTTLDVASGTIQRSASMPQGLGEDIVNQITQNTLVLTIQVAGVERHLLLDTGSGFTLLNGEGGEPGDVQANFVDWNGDEVEAYLGSAELSIGGAVGKVPVLRTPSFAGVEYAAESTGLPITGLLGLSSINMLHVDPAGPRVRILPRFQD